MIYHQLLILFSSALHFISASDLPPKKQSAWTSVKRQIFGNLKYVPDSRHVESETFNPLLLSLHRESKRSILESLAGNVLFLILENFIDDYTKMRLVSKSIRKTFDDMIFSIFWMKFPFFTKETFSHWNDEDPMKANEEYLKYQLILLVRVLSSKMEILINCFKNSQARLDLTTIDQIRLNAVQLIRIIKPWSIKTCLELTNVFLKLKFVVWNDIYHFLFFRNSITTYDSWTLGLTTIAREMSIHHTEKFIDSVGPGPDGLLYVLSARKYHLARFMIHFLRDRSYRFKKYKTFVNYVIEELVLAKYWDLLEEMYKISKKSVKSLHVLYLAYYGHVGGLRAFKDLAKSNSDKVAYLAASRGRLEFLKELDAIGLLQKSCYLSIHAALLHGHTECLDFLVNLLGSKYLSYSNLARKSENLEMLRETIFSKVAPYYNRLRLDP